MRLVASFFLVVACFAQDNPAAKAARKAKSDRLFTALAFSDRIFDDCVTGDSRRIENFRSAFWRQFSG